MENEKILTLYKNKILNMSLLIWGILIGGFALWEIIIFCALDIVLYGKIVMNVEELVEWGFFEFILLGLSRMFLKEFFKSNKENKNRMFVKENGRVYDGTVLQMNAIKTNKKDISNIVVEFCDIKGKRLIVVENFPHYIEESKNNSEIDEYNGVYQDNIKHVQYLGNGYISFEETDQTENVYKYNISKNKNYKGNIRCKVYEYEGKYVVDDFEGYYTYALDSILKINRE